MTFIYCVKSDSMFPEQISYSVTVAIINNQQNFETIYLM